MKKFLHYLFGFKLVFLIVNILVLVVSITTISILITNLFNIKGELSLTVLLTLIMNSLFLLSKVCLNILSLIISYKDYLNKDKELSKSVKLFKKILESEDFRL